MPLVYKCDKCGSYTDSQKILCPGCAILSMETVPSASSNSDYAAALRVINLYCDNHFNWTITKLQEFCRERLNSAKAPNCA